MIEKDITKEKSEDNNTKEEEPIEIVKLHRQVQINKTDLQILLSTECISEDMNYLLDKAMELLSKL